MNFPKVGIGVLIFKDEKILLGQRKSEHGNATWGPPGGHLEFGESFEDCASREVLEETGLKINQAKFLTATNDVFWDSMKHYVSVFMLTSYCDGQIIKNMEPDKIESWQWFDIRDLPQNLFLPLKNLLASKTVDFIALVKNLHIYEEHGFL